MPIFDADERFMMQRITQGWLAWVTGYPKVVLGLIGLFIVAAAIGLPRFKLDASADALTLENDRDLSYFRELSKSYGSGEFLVVTFTPRDEDLFSDQSLAILGALQGDLAAIDGVANVNSILNVPLLFSPPQSLRDIAKTPKTLLSAKVDRALAKQEFLDTPIYKDMILSPDGQTTALQLNIAVDTHYIELVQARDALRAKQSTEGLTESEEQELVSVSNDFLVYRTQSEDRSRQRIRDIRAVTSQYLDRAEIFVGGVSMITADMILFIRNDLVVFGAAALLFMIAVLAVIFRSLRFVVIPMATCTAAVFLMLGLVSWLDWRLTVISSNFVALLLIISLAIIIHLVVRYREYAVEQPGWSQRELVVATVQYMAKPCLYTALTTIVAFVSLVTSDIRPVMDFGWMMTIGLVVALTLAFALLPAALMLLPRSTFPPQADSGNRQKAKRGLTAICARWVETRGLWIWLGALIIAGLSTLGISRLQVENRFIDYFHEDTEIHQGLYVIDNKLGGTTSLDIIVQAKAIDGLLIDPLAMNMADEDDPFAEGDPFDEPDPFGRPNPVTEEDPFAEADPFSEHGEDDKSVWMTVTGLQAVESIHDYLESLPQVGKVQSLATLYKVGQSINGSLNNFELALMEQSLSAEVGSVLLDPYIQGRKETRITMRVVDSYPGLQRAKLVEDIETHLRDTLKVNTEEVRFSGLLVLYNNMLQSLFSSQIVTLGAVFLGIFLMFLILFRSIKIAIVAILPNALAAGSILGAMGLAGIPLDMMTITVAAITVGIGVDDTIHYIHRFKTELAKDGHYMQAMHRAHGSIGKAMYYTSIIIIFGFSIMVLSQFIPTIYFGVLTGMAMLAALTGALLLLPKLILLVRPFKAETI